MELMNLRCQCPTVMQFVVTRRRSEECIISVDEKSNHSHPVRRIHQVACTHTWKLKTKINLECDQLPNTIIVMIMPYHSRRDIATQKLDVRA